MLDIVIIGAGPAGLTAAIYAARSDLKIAVVEKEVPGGKLLNTHLVENYPGIDKKPGPDIAMEILEQYESFGQEVIIDEVVGIKNIASKEKEVVLKSKKILKTKTILIASGTLPIPLPLENYDKYLNKGVYNCLVCDGPLYRGKNIAIIGGGNSATEESLFAAGFVKEVHIINKFPSFHAENITLDKLKKLPNIKLVTDTEVKDILGDGNKVTGLKLYNSNTKKESELPVDAVFVYVGYAPNAEFFISTSLKQVHKFLLVNPQTMETIIKGVFACGDIIDKPIKQLTGATSDGTIAALMAQRYIEHNF